MAQQVGRTYRLGCLLPLTRDAPLNIAFFDELRRRGFIEGHCSNDARLRTRNESRETRANRMVIVHPDAMGVVQENPQSFSMVHSFEQGQEARPDHPIAGH
jgi:hypothetical protein